jgi:hypothetical protein
MSLKGSIFISLHEETSEFNIEAVFFYINNVEAVVNDNDMEKGNNENLNEGAFFDEWETSQR